MFRLSRLVAASGLMLIATCGSVLAQTDAKPATSDAVNTHCPIGKQPIDGKTFVSFKGHKVGFCCPGCDAAFDDWTDARKVEYIRTSMTKQLDEKKQPATAKARGDWYPLATCAVAGRPLGANVVVREYEGREVRFCCGGCVGRFEGDVKAGFKKVDKEIIKQQVKVYPTNMCIVSNEPLEEDGEDISINYVHNNRLVRLCCRMCAREMLEDPMP